MAKNWKVYDKPASLDHALYEIEMLTESVLALSRANVAGTSDANAWLEVYALHFRNLNDFFSNKVGNDNDGYMKPHHFVEWVYSYAFDGPLAGRASSQVAHLTYNRERPEEKSSWPIKTSFGRLREQSIAFLNAVADVEPLMNYKANRARTSSLLLILRRLELTQ